MAQKTFYVYILSSGKNGTIYIGFTSDLKKRVWEHKNGVIKGFTKRYGITNLVYYEIFDDPENAILREKQMKKWKREWKTELIEETNPEWNDLYEKICQ